MHSFAPFLLAAAGAALAAPGSVCNKRPYVNLLPLSEIPAVESFCSSRFPVDPVTRTSTRTITRTVNGNGGRATVTSTVTSTSQVGGAAGQTITVTTTSAGATDTVTIPGADATTTIVTDGAGNVFKRTLAAREAMPTAEADLVERDDSDRHMAHQNIIAKRDAQQGYGYGNPKPTTTKGSRASSALAQLTSGRPRSVISAACSCIETPATRHATVTRTKTSTRGAQGTVTRTSTTTTTTTLANGATLTVTSTVGGNDVTTTTTAAGAITTVNACGTTQPGPADQFPILTQCGTNANNGGTVIQQTIEASWFDCFTLADNSFSTTSFTFQYSNGQCTLYNDVDNDFTTVADADFAYSCFEQTGCGQ